MGDICSLCVVFALTALHETDATHALYWHTACSVSDLVRYAAPEERQSHNIIQTYSMEELLWGESAHSEGRSCKHTGCPLMDDPCVLDLAHSTSRICEQ